MQRTLLFICFLFFQYTFCQSWTLIQAGEDIYNGQLQGTEWPGRWDIESLDMKPVEGGFVSCGYYNDQIFDSTDGNTYDLSNKYGAYLVKYNNEGVLQWLVRTEKATSSERDVIMSIAIDSQNNIYIVGHSEGKLYDSTGNVQQIASPAFLMKFNENGEFLWKMHVFGLDAKRVAVDKEDNIVVCGSIWTKDTSMFFNDQYVGEFSNITDSDVNYYIAKYKNDGSPLWDAGIFIKSVNDQFVEGITFDDNNNVYVHGVYEMDLKIYDADETNYIQRDWSGYYGGSMFLAKYTPDGDAQWIVNSNDSKLTKIITNGDGSHFITGNNSVSDGQGSQLMMHADETAITQNIYGPFYFAKINTDGTWAWLTGSTGTGYGYGVEMLKYDNKVSVFGNLNYFGGNAEGKLHSVDVDIEVNINTSDAFIATYDMDGNLVNVSMSGHIGDDYAASGTSGFIRDEEGFFYIQRNMMGFMDNQPKEFYGQMIAPAIGNDATITKFKETDVLGISKVSVNTGQLTPNPTDEDFVINLESTYVLANLIITDISGKIIFEKNYTNDEIINGKIKGTEGIYFAKITIDRGKTLNFKVLKK